MVARLLAMRGAALRALLAAAIVTLALPASAGALSGAPAVAGPGVISGTAYNSKTGNVVVGVPVTLWQVTGEDPNTGIPSLVQVASGSTDASGTYRFSGLAVSTATTTMNYIVGVKSYARDTGGEDYRASYYYDAATPAYASWITLPDPQGLTADPNVWDVADLELTPVGPSFSGKITGSDNGLPVRGADVSLYRLEGGEFLWNDFATTGADGLYEFWSRPSGGYKIAYEAQSADANGVRWKPECFGGTPSLTGATALSFTSGISLHLTGKNIVLDKAHAVLKGTVWQADVAGKRVGTVPFADVALVTAGSSVETPALWASTDSTGRYEFYDADLMTAGLATTTTALGFSAPKFADTWWSGKSSYATSNKFPISTAQATVTRDATLTPAVPSLAGTVTAAGVPVPGLAVGIYDAAGGDAPLGVAETDALGRYTWWVPSLASGREFKIRFYTGDVADAGFDTYVGRADTPSEYVSEWFSDAPDAASATTVTLVAGTTTEADAQLAAATPAITGSAMDASGAPVAGVQPIAWKQDGSEWLEYAWASAPTGADGAYAIFGLPSGTYHVGHIEGFEPDGNYYRAGFWNGKQTAAAGDAIAFAGTTRSGINVVYRALPPLFTGTVKDSKTMAPIEGAVVTAWTLRNDPVAGPYWDWAGMPVVTESDGRYAYYGSTAGTCKVSFEEDMQYLGEFYLNKPLHDAYGDFNAAAASAVLTAPGATKTAIDGTLSRIAHTGYRVAPNNDRFILAGSIAGMQSDSFSASPNIILASGEDAAMADPLSAAGLSWAYGNAPLLLTKRLAVPSVTKAKIASAVDSIRRAHTGEGVTLQVVGGAYSVPDARVAEIRSYVQSRLGLTAAQAASAVKVRRYAGRNRYDVARLIAGEMKTVRGSEMATFALVANGSDPAKFWDALAASPVAAAKGAPLLLVQTNGLPNETKNAKTALGFTGSQMVVVGPTSSVSAGVMSSLKSTRRVGSGDRFTTAKAFADWAIANGFLGREAVGICAKLPDALTGGTYCGSVGGALLFTNTTGLPLSTKNFLTARKGTLEEIDVFGGTGSVANVTLTAVNTALRP